MAEHLTLEELHRGLAEIRRSPTDEGRLKSIVIRPAVNERLSLLECQISPELGVQGDNWAMGCWKSLPNGKPHPDVQVSIMNARAIALIAQQEERWSLVGDNLYLDMNLSDENLRLGQRLALGSAILEITPIAHNGCKKFGERYGADAVTFVNSDVDKQLHLRGIYARILEAGVIRVGDVARKIKTPQDQVIKGESSTVLS